MQEIVLDSKIKLLDCPGIVLPGKGCDESTAALRNSVKIEDIADVFTPINAILKRADKSHLMIHYRLPDFKNTDDFLSVLAKRFGKLKKHGIPDKESAARKLLHDWNSGTIKYYTQPPETTDIQIGATLTKELSAEFDLTSLHNDELSLMKELPIHRPSKTMKITSLGPVTDVMDVESQDQEESDMEADEAQDKQEDDSTSVLGNNVCINIEPETETNKKTEEKKARWETQVPTFDPETMSLQKYQKKMMKKARKERNRNEKRVDSLANELDTLMNKKSEDYDFNEYFA